MFMIIILNKYDFISIIYNERFTDYKNIFAIIIYKLLYGLNIF